MAAGSSPTIPPRCCLYVEAPSAASVKVFLLNVETGQREVWREPAPADLAGVTGLRVVPTPDGKAYAYSYRRELSTLYLVEGLR